MKPKHVFAHYFTWFATKPLSGKWCHWDWKDTVVHHNPDIFLEGSHRDIAATTYPLIGPYDSSSKEAVKYHVELAKAALIDAFCVDWYGPESDPSLSATDREAIRDPLVDRNFKIFLDVAEEAKFSACICYEEKLLTQAKLPPSENEPIRRGKLHFEYVAEHYFSRKGYWTIEGRPVVVIWGNHSLSAGAWREILSTVEKYRPFIFYVYHWPLQKTLLESKGLIDGFYSWMNIKDMAGQKQDIEDYFKFAQGNLSLRRNRLLGAGVWPGFDDTGVRGWGIGPRVIPDPKDALYDLTWQACLDHDVDVVSIATWNDWNEGSEIEPNEQLRFKRLEQTRRYIQKLKKLKEEPFSFGKVAKPGLSQVCG